MSVVSIIILLLGIGSLVIATLGVILTAKRLMNEADEIEAGINDIINGNLDRSILPVGSEMDGLANSVNVMLARLLGRPDPGDEVYDDEGNLVSPDKLEIDTALSNADQEAVALAQEPEPDYYSRIYGEYIEARNQVGESMSTITYENFITKLRFNENSLTKKYQCSAIRFKVVIDENRVTLKPIPIM